MSFCTQCGQEIRGETTFCTGCGTELSAAGAARGPGQADAEPGGYAATVVVTPPPEHEPAPPGLPPIPVAPWSAGPGPAAFGAPGLGGPEPDLVQSGPRRRRPRGQAILAAAAAAVVVAGGGAAAWRLAGSPTAGAAAPARSAAAASRLPRPPSPPPSTFPASTGPDTASSPVPSATQAAGVPVAAAAAQQPGAGQVSAFVARYFAAINQRDYPAFIALFAPGAQPVPSRQQFLSGYQSTIDSAATLAGLTPTAAGWAARVTFVSHQDPAASATNSACTSWDITLFLAPDGSTYLIEAPPPGYHASDASCS
jgi:zinc-ribbon domain